MPLFTYRVATPPFISTSYISLLCFFSFSFVVEVLTLKYENSFCYITFYSSDSVTDYPRSYHFYI